MSKARQLADLGNVYDDGAITGTNMVINGGMTVAQRGNRSPSGFSGSFYGGPDRWLVNRSGTGTTGFSQISSTDFGGLYAAEATFLAASGETFIVTQRIEGDTIGHLAGETVTLSFWVKGSSDTGGADLSASLSYAGAKDNFSSETVISSNSVSYSGTATKFTFTFTLPSQVTNGVAVRFSGTKTAATGTFTLTFGGVQLEVGDTATPFEHRSYGDELQKCQRYYFSSDEADSFISAFDVTSGNTYYFTIINPVTMRSSPTITLSNESNSSFDNITVFRNYATRWGGYDVATASGRGYFQFEYVADAEL